LPCSHSKENTKEIDFLSVSRSPLVTISKPLLRKSARVTRDAAYRALSNKARRTGQPSIQTEEQTPEETAADIVAQAAEILAGLDPLIELAVRKANTIKSDFGRSHEEYIYFHKAMLRLIKLESQLQLIEKACSRLVAGLKAAKIEDFHDPERKRKNFLNPRSRGPSNRDVAILERIVQDSHIARNVDDLRLFVTLLRQQAFQKCSALMSKRGGSDVRLDLAYEVLVDSTGEQYNRQKAQELSMLLEEWL